MLECGFLLGGDWLMETIYICGSADISRDESTILISTDGRKKRFPVETVRHVVMTADGTLTTKFLSLCGRNGIRVSIFDHYGWYKGAFEPVVNVGCGEVKVRQAKLLLDDTRRMVVARDIIRASMENIIGNLRYYAYRGRDDLKPLIAKIDALKARLPEAADAETAMGFEGMARRAYYEAWGLIDKRLAFAPRVKRPPNNQVNCLISFLNGMTYSAIRHEIAKTHLDETLSVLHAPSAGRSSLSLDLSEPFKPRVVDRLIFTAVRKGMIGPDWFDEQPGVCLLTEKGRRSLVELFAGALDSQSGVASLRGQMRTEALKLQRHILDMEDYVAYRSKD
jgi:CRISPR-associated protein Cas1